MGGPWDLVKCLIYSTFESGSGALNLVIPFLFATVGKLLDIVAFILAQAIRAQVIWLFGQVI